MILLYSVIFGMGLVGGVSVGAIGIGTTLLLLPTFATIFPLFFAKAIALKMAVATTLASSSVAALISTLAHKKKGYINMAVFKWLAPVYLVVAICGVRIVHYVPAHTFKMFVGVVLIIIACIVIFAKKETVAHTEKLPPRLLLMTMGTIACLSNSMCGIATSTFMIPFLKRYLTNARAVATSIASTLVAGMTAAITYIISGLEVSHTTVHFPPYSLGYLYLPAFALAAVAILISVPIGIRLSVQNKFANQFRILLAILIIISGITCLV